MIRHHPDPAALFEYATGAAPEPVAVIVASHLAYCAECRDEVARLETVGGVLVGGLDAAAMAPDALAATMARLAEPAPPAALAPALDEASRRIVPPPLRPYVGRGLASLKWRRRTWSLEEAQLDCRVRGYRFSLIRLPPKSWFPHHEHLGQEFTLVLSGSYDDAHGHYGVGDLEFADGALKHSLKSDEGCICAVALDAGVRFTGLFGALVNPFVPKRFG
jgi:putative transcriptional regulator